MEKHKGKLKLLYVGLILLALDAMSKWLAQRYLPPLIHDTGIYPYGGIGVFHNLLGIDFSLNYATNLGAAWGLFAKFHNILLGIRLIVIGGMLSYLLFANKERKYQVPLLLILSGAIGNVVDTFIYGHVVDLFFFHFWGYGFPVFNLADSYIFLGVMAISFSLLIKKRTQAIS